MNKKISVAVLVFALYIMFAAPASAKTSDNSTSTDIPEQNGTYNVPGHPNLKVRVFVHYPKKNVSQPVWPACTDDPKSSEFVHPAGWHLPDGNWNYVINTGNVPSSIGSGNFLTLVSNAFGEWEENQKSVTFQSAGTANIAVKKLDGKNLVTFGRTSASALGVTYTWYYSSSGEAVETDTILNMKFPWFWNQCNPSAYDAQGTLTHELGHWIGLDDEYDSKYIPNTMYGYGSKGDTKNMTLTEGDISGLQAIYK